MDISTGGYRLYNTGATGASSYTGMSSVLFDGQSSEKTVVLHVTQGKSVLLTAYSISDDGVVYVSGASLASSSLPSMQGTCCTPAGAKSSAVNSGAVVIPRILFHSPMKLGGNPWVINSKNPRLLISIPGTYLVTINDLTTIDEGQVEYVSFDVVGNMPHAYYAGVVNQGALPEGVE